MRYFIPTIDDIPELITMYFRKLFHGKYLCVFIDNYPTWKTIDKFCLLVAILFI